MSNNVQQPGFPLTIGALILWSQLITAAVGVVDANSSSIQVDTTLQAVAVDLPAAAQYKDRVLVISQVKGATFATTITPFAGDTVNGAASQALTVAGKMAIIQSDGVSNWKVLLAN